MGYCVTMDCNNVNISLENANAALQAVKDLQKDTSRMSGGCSAYQGQPAQFWYGFTIPAQIMQAATLIDVLKAWRYEAEEQDDGSISVSYFSGEKLADDAILWKALAPFVNPEAEILCTGEDDYHWKWTFTDNKFHELSGKVVYEE